MLRASVTIQSPLSIVKELVENSLDGGATIIQVQIDSTTLGSLMVTDNGTGIHPKDRELLALPSTTSKIRNFEDIQDVSSFGFRGEALSAIADISESSNSRMTFTTRIKSEAHGVQWSVDRTGQPIPPYNPVAAQVGTVVALTNLFARYPVRRKILLKESAKTLKATEQILLVYSVIYLNSKIELRIKSGQRNQEMTKVFTGRNELEKLANFYGVKSTRNLVHGVFEDNLHKADGGAWKWTYVVPNPAVAGPVSTTINLNLLVVNNRPMNPKNPIVSKIIQQINSALCSRNIWFISISLPTDWYDINIEPSKDDIQFKDTEYMISRINQFLSSINATSKSDSENYMAKSVTPAIFEEDQSMGLLTPDASFEVEDSSLEEYGKMLKHAAERSVEVQLGSQVPQTSQKSLNLAQHQIISSSPLQQRFLGNFPASPTRPVSVGTDLGTPPESAQRRFPPPTPTPTRPSERQTVPSSPIVRGRNTPSVRCAPQINRQRDIPSPSSSAQQKRGIFASPLVSSKTSNSSFISPATRIQPPLSSAYNASSSPLHRVGKTNLIKSTTYRKPPVSSIESQNRTKFNGTVEDDHNLLKKNTTIFKFFGPKKTGPDPADSVLISTSGAPSQPSTTFAENLPVLEKDIPAAKPPVTVYHSSEIPLGCSITIPIMSSLRLLRYYSKIAKSLELDQEPILEAVQVALSARLGEFQAIREIVPAREGEAWGIIRFV